MEIYYNTVDFVRHTVFFDNEIRDPDNEEVFYVIEDEDGNEIASDQATRVSEGVYRATIDQSLTSEYTSMRIQWQYGITENATFIQVETEWEHIFVVRPYVTVGAYNNQLMTQEEPLSPTDFKQLESVVRGVIDAYCRQNFQLTKNSYLVPGGGMTKLQLPFRLVRLDSIYAADEPFAAMQAYEGIYDHTSEQERMRADALSMHSLNEFVTFTKDHPWEIRRRTRATTPGISPVSAQARFESHRYYIVEGLWGWERVPNDVARAAAILTRDYLDDDSKWREKYVSVARAADWRLEFSATGNETTGNANADMILEKYRNFRWEVL